MCCTAFRYRPAAAGAAELSYNNTEMHPTEATIPAPVPSAAISVGFGHDADPICRHTSPTHEPSQLLAYPSWLVFLPSSLLSRLAAGRPRCTQLLVATSPRTWESLSHTYRRYQKQACAGYSGWDGAAFVAVYPAAPTAATLE